MQAHWKRQQSAGQRNSRISKGSKYALFEVSGSITYAFDGFWNQTLTRFVLGLPGKFPKQNCNGCRMAAIGYSCPALVGEGRPCCFRQPPYVSALGHLGHSKKYTASSPLLQDARAYAEKRRKHARHAPCIHSWACVGNGTSPEIPSCLLFRSWCLVAAGASSTKVQHWESVASYPAWRL